MSRLDDTLPRHGRRLTRQRTHTIWSLFGLTTCAMSTWVGILSGTSALDNGGTPNLIYGFFFCWLGGLATAASLAELSSMYVLLEFSSTLVLTYQRSRISRTIPLGLDARTEIAKEISELVHRLAHIRRLDR